METQDTSTISKVKIALPVFHGMPTFLCFNEEAMLFYMHFIGNQSETQIHHTVCSFFILTNKNSSYSEKVVRMSTLPR